MVDELAAGSRSGNPLRSIVIVGGGTAGWMAAVLLAKRLERQDIEITVVDSSSIKTVGVGEATTPAIRDFLRSAEVSEVDMLKASSGTIKLGIRFDGWAGEGTRFFHPFGLYGTASNGVAFHHYWLKARAAGSQRPLDDYSLCTRLAQSALVMPPVRPASADWQFFDWAFHFDAAAYARFLKGIALSRGVRHIDAKVDAIDIDPETGFIRSLVMGEAVPLAGDLFVDCSGFRSLLLGGSLQIPFVDWSDLLPCDRAVAIPCARAEAFDPFTRSTALAAGWQWRIPLQHRVGNGYVYSSAFISDDEASAVLHQRLEGEPLADPNILHFKAGHRARFWEKNCVGIGLSAGFLEPLESTSITLIYSGIERLLQLLPDRHCDPALADEFNRVTTLEYERIRDFLLLHYWGNGRGNEPFWARFGDVELPEALAHKIRMFESRGRLVRYEWESFQDPSWLSLYAGLGILPTRWDPLADVFPLAEVEGALARISDAIANDARKAISHEQFIHAHVHAG